MIDDEDTRFSFIAHEWERDGEREVGGERQRCTRCGTLSHWPGARRTCSMVLSKFAMRSGYSTPLHADQYEGPYVDGVEPQCSVCGRRYRKPSKHANGRSCSVACSAALRRKSIDRQHVVEQQRNCARRIGR